MGGAKDIIVRPIAAQDAARIVRECHYSGKTVNNSQLHFGVFIGDKCGGAMQFGPSLDKRKMLGLVRGTLWNEFLELNRMAFADWLPRNSESRAIAVAMRLIRKAYPWIKWVVSFADATQCGDGTIYRASGFVLTGIKVNNQIWEMPSGETCTRMVATDTRRPERGRLIEKASQQVFSRTSLTDGRSKQQQRQAKAVVSRTTTTEGGHILETGASSMKIYKDAGWKPKAGFQLRYIYFLHSPVRADLTVPEIPFSEITARGAGMYKGRPKPSSEAAGHQPAEGGAEPTRTLQTSNGPT